MGKQELTVPEPRPSAAARVSEAILDFLGHIPATERRRSRHPDGRARQIANAAASKAALTAGGLALPPGPLGWLTVLPELIAVWKLQAQMVADIAGVYGKKASLRREQMIYCLFRHTAAQAVRDLVVRVGERYLVRQVSLRAFQSVAQRVGVRISQRSLGAGLSRWLPVIGAIGVGAYAYYDTASVARTAIELFQREIEVEP